ncbi:TIP41-like protein [Limulus polyphemus]|uniref:TIP41-like protein n=1 Tax=Limulus polyphemus TaxID=6850 RepID=A0ABM1SEC9_LIMPO|nr:TIP41-like protein [Limulus polyphemus]XP_013774849.1 TIP41-like protein [Limulus polyphemus]XP_013774850.1 TIP41-like protein [Limulus polyphemus]XP_013774851.1 TIP41-like protein [Limulus polyphemus]XP_022241984.1 TIP41-like protein [Limulus polyphemus]XP_022241986.1 TIP41-like protein [Limulus polyphemus]XP_022241987.1 TIP41-like protein [Limulus polyphemus]
MSYPSKTEVGDIKTKADSICVKTYTFGPWTLITQKNHILPSKCSTPQVCHQEKDTTDSYHLCSFCRFQQELTLPQLPEMTFADNLLQIKHERGFGIEFNCLDALRLVDTKNDIMKVAVAEVWQNTRAECKYVKEVIKPFDWTFTTAYKGTLMSTDNSLQVSETSERIDIEKLKVREKILFFEDIHLFEDELADNGCAQCSVKIRVMQGSFFLLLRFFLRVDNILVRINDTRVYHEESKNYLLREYVSRESQISDLKIPSSLLTDPGELWTHLPIISSCYEKLEFPTC